MVRDWRELERIWALALALLGAACGAPGNPAGSPGTGATSGRHGAGCAPGPGLEVVAPDMAEVDRFITAATELGAFSGSVLLARGDSILLHRGYGLASEDPCVLAGPETGYHIGSVAKQFLATAVLRLVEDGALALEDSIGEVLPSVPADKRGITIHHLLTHTSGLPAELFGHGSEPDPGREQVIARILGAKLLSQPGSGYLYSNPGFTLLTAIVEAVSGESFELHAPHRLFLAAGLERTGFVGNGTRLGVEGLARGFWGRYADRPLSARDPEWTVMPGEIISAVGDLHRWFRALWTGQILGKDAVRQMFTPHATDYGYGWHVRNREDGTPGVVFHNGDAGEYAVALRYYPGSDLVAIAATNRVVQDAKQHDDILNSALDIMAGGEGGLPAVAPVSTLPRDWLTVGTPGGGYTLHTDVAGGLWIAPQDCHAVAGLFAYIEGVEERCSAEVEKTLGFARELYRSPRECDDTGDRVERAQLLGAWDRLPCALEGALGPLDRVEGIAARPLTWNRQRGLVWTRHVHRDGTRAVTWLWEGDRLIEVWTDSTVHTPQSVRIAPLDDSTAVMFDWFAGQSIRIRLGLGGGVEIESGGLPQ